MHELAGGDLEMQKSKRRVKLFGSDRAREWTTDFLIGIGMFLLVAFLPARTQILRCQLRLPKPR